MRTPRVGGASHRVSDDRARSPRRGRSRSARRSSELLGAVDEIGDERARSRAGCCPPSVRVRILMRSFIDRLVAARDRARRTNFYRDGGGAALRRDRLAAYLEQRAGAPILLVGEAPGYRGARVSGIPFTSERQLTGTGPAEATATIVHRVLAELGLDRPACCSGTSCRRTRAPRRSNRAPTRDEVAAGLPFARRARARPARDRGRPARRTRRSARLRPAPVARRRARVPRAASLR